MFEGFFLEVNTLTNIQKRSVSPEGSDEAAEWSTSKENSVVSSLDLVKVSPTKALKVSG